MILNINISRSLVGLFLAIHLGAAVLIMTVPLEWFWRLGLWVLLGGSLYQALFTHAWRSAPFAVTAIDLDSEGGVSVRLAGSERWQPARITSRFVHPWISLMTLRLENRRRPVKLVIAADAVEPEPFRRWRVALLYQVVPE